MIAHVVPQTPKIGELFTKRNEEFCEYLSSDHFKGIGPECKKVLFATLVLDMVAHGAYLTHIGAVYYWSCNPQKFRIVPFIQYRKEISRARNAAVQTAISGDFDYLFFYDDDTLMPEGVIPRLLNRMEEFNAVSASYFVRGYPFSPMVFRWDRKGKLMKLVPAKNYRRLIDPDGMMRNRVAGLGNGCTMLRVEDFKKVPFPWFQAAPNYSEDVYWYYKARKYVPDYRVGMDFSVKAGHLLDPLYVDSENVNILRKAYKQLRNYET